MLVSQVGEVVDSLDIIPEPLFWKIINWDEWGNDVSWLWETVGNSAWRFFTDFSTSLD
jgi:hypothetical protein